MLYAPLNLAAGEFLNTVMHLNFLYMYGVSTWGDITTYEHNNFAIKDPDNGMRNARPDHKDNAFGFFMDITPFRAFLLGNEDNAIKLGFRFSYKFHSVGQTVQLENKSYKSDLMNFQAFMGGIVLYYAPTVEPAVVSKNYNSSKGLTFFVMYGQLQGGEISAFPVWKKTDPDTYPLAVSSTKIKGNKFDIGFGGEVSICGSVSLGLNIYYSLITYTMNDKIYSRVGRNSTLNEVGLELFIGIPIQYF